VPRKRSPPWSHCTAPHQGERRRRCVFVFSDLLPSPGTRMTVSSLNRAGVGQGPGERQGCRRHQGRHERLQHDVAPFGPRGA
jgi:hypothetical protein